MSSEQPYSRAPTETAAVWALAGAAGVVLLVFIVAAVIALILNPMVTVLQRARLPRAVAVAVVYVGGRRPALSAVLGAAGL